MSSSFPQNGSWQYSIDAPSSARFVCRGSWRKAAPGCIHYPQQQKSVDNDCTQTLLLKQSELNALDGGKGMDTPETNQSFELFEVAQAAVEQKLLAKIITNIQARTVPVHQIFISSSHQPGTTINKGLVAILRSIQFMEILPLSPPNLNSVSGVTVQLGSSSQGGEWVKIEPYLLKSRS